MTLRIESPAFPSGAAIPSRHTCDGENLSPLLSWQGVPEGARTLALICEDPDAPRGTWSHWVLFDLPPSVSSLPEGVPASEKISGGGMQGINDSNRAGYDGPCPPGGTHRYFFRLYALDGKLSLPGASRRADLLRAMAGRILAEAELMGTYSRR